MATLQKRACAHKPHINESRMSTPHKGIIAVPEGTNPGRRNNLTTLNLLLPCCKHTSLTGCFCLRLLWQEDHVLISICCTSTIHLHARPQGKHSTHCANRSDPCRKAPAFLVRSDGAYRAYTLRRSWTWLICKVEHMVPLKYHCQEGTRGFWFSFEVSLCSVKQTSLSTIESSKRRWHAIKCPSPARKAQATKDVLVACLATRCHCYRHKLGET